MEWMWEKKLFDRVASIKTFRQFYIKKTFSNWHRNIRETKQEKSKAILSRQLFSSNEIFQKVLLYVRNLCERASSSNIFDIGPKETSIIMIKYDQSKVYDLSEFASLQDEQIELSLQKLFQLKREIMDVTYKACIVSQLKRYFPQF
jgi:hypothetical protein